MAEKAIREFGSEGQAIAALTKPCAAAYARARSKDLGDVKIRIGLRFRPGAAATARSLILATNIEGIRSDLSELASDTETSLKRAATQAADKARDIGAQVATKYNDLKPQLHDLQSEAIVRTRNAASVTANYARARPLQTLGIVALLGVAVGLLLNRRN